ncbi:MAG: VOC family protein [Chloroflexi bacterium]|nr:VOC family protein [Chloroflexota bacterium]
MIAPILAVEDVDRSLAFYTKQLAFRQDFCLEGADGQSAFAFVSMGEGADRAAIGLSRQPLEGPRGQGVVFTVYIPKAMEIDRYYEAVRSRGVPLEEEIKTQYWGDRSFSLRDPDGYYLSLSQTVAETDMDHVRSVMRGES